VKPKISVILVNYGTTGLLLDALDSLHRNFDAASYEVLVVDNSTPGFEPIQITGRYPGVTVLVNRINVGFGRANNQAAAAALGTYLWLLNTDTLVPPDHNLHLLLKFLDSHIGHAAASPLLIDRDGRVQPGQRASFPGLARMLAEKPARLVARLVPSTRPLFARLTPDFAGLEESDVPVAVAASLFVRTSCFRDVGGFSPEFFMFLEDSDLCRKFADKGYKVRFVPQARMVHLWGGSIDSQYEAKRMYYASQDIYLQKWSPRWVPALARMLRVPFRFHYSRDRYR